MQQRRGDRRPSGRIGWRAAFVAGLVAAAVLLGYGIRRTSAEGPPTADALSFTGMLAEAGLPVNGTRDITVGLYLRAEGGAPLCSWSQLMTRIVQGRFRVPLRDPACTEAVATNPELWVQILIGDIPLPRMKVGAVPYALEAGHAMAASDARGALEARFAALEARLDGIDERLRTGLPKAWVHFVDTPTTIPDIRGSHNVRGVAAVGPGDYTVTFERGFLAQRYAACATTNLQGPVTYETNVAGSINLNTWHLGTQTDGNVLLVVVGEQE